MKKLLVVTADFFPVENANTGIEYRLLQQLKEKYEITVATINTLKADDEEEKDGIRIVRLPYHTLRKGLGSEGNSAFDSFVIATKKVEGKLLQRDIDLKDAYFFLKGIKRRLDLSSFDLLLSFSGPFVSHYCASRIAEKYIIPWTAYYVDPFFSNVTLNKANLGKRKRFEEKTLCKARKALLMFPTDRDYKEHQVGFSSKIRTMQIPGIRVQEQDPGEMTNHGNEIHCYFFGNLYRDIRDPIQTLRLFSSCEETVKLFLVGGCDHGDLSQYEKLIPKEKSEDIIFHGRRPREEVRELYGQADILVNIGNRCLNQMPSKLFEYINTRKPIINIYMSEECPSLDCLRDYPLVWNISEKEIKESPVKCAEEMTAFLQSVRGKHVSTQEILDHYSRNTDEAVAAKLAEELEM